MRDCRYLRFNGLIFCIIHNFPRPVNPRRNFLIKQNDSFILILSEKYFLDEEIEFSENSLKQKGSSELVETFYSIFWQKHLAYPV